MNGSGDSSLTNSRASHGFLERVRKALSHDLHTPLGTIANYAAILEYHSESKPEDVRVFAGRIRASAVATASMLQWISSAIALSEMRRERVGVDTAALLRGELSTLGLYAQFPGHAAERTERIVFDHDLLAFSWRAFLAVHSEAKPGTSLDIDIVTARDGEGGTIELWVGGKSTPTMPRVSVAQFTSEAVHTSTPVSCFALGLAEELFQVQGGTISLSGSPGQVSSLRATLPHAA